jgi:hypothetical protein
MRRILTLLAAGALVVTVFTPATVAAAPADSAPVRGVVDMAFPYGGACPTPPATVPAPAECWHGTITGDITGTIWFWETDRNRFPGHTEHFFEVFLITGGDGSISGYDNGVWNFATFKFRAEGRVTAASGGWTGLVGRKYFESGRTSDPNAGLPVTADDMQVFLAKAQGE